MYNYSFRKKIEYTLRRLPNFISNFFVDLVNPIRNKNVKKNIHPKWITLFITNYCSSYNLLPFGKIYRSRNCNNSFISFF